MRPRTEDTSEGWTKGDHLMPRNKSEGGALERRSSVSASDLLSNRPQTHHGCKSRRTVAERGPATRRFSVSSESFDELLKMAPWSKSRVEGLFCTRADKEILCHPRPPKREPLKPKDEREERIIRALESSAVTRNHRESFPELIGVLKERKTAPGEVVMREGDTKAHEFYIVEKGVFVVTAHDHNGQGTVATLGPGRTFGELALMYDVACSQTVTSATEGILWVMQRETYRRVIMTNVVKKRRRYLSFLSAVPLLHGFRRYDLELIADAVEHVIVPAGTDVIHQGDTTTDQFYIIEWGRASVSRKDKYGATTLCAELGAGDYFGEIAFLTHQARRVTVTAVCQRHRHIAFVQWFSPCLFVSLARKPSSLFCHSARKTAPFCWDHAKRSCGRTLLASATTQQRSEKGQRSSLRFPLLFLICKQH